MQTARGLAPGEKATVLARVESSRLSGFHRRALGLFEATLSDGSGSLMARWFNGKHLADLLTSGTRVALFGKVEYDRQRLVPLMVQPDFEIVGDNEEDEALHTGRIVPIYEAIGKISSRTFRVLLHRVLTGHNFRTMPCLNQSVNASAYPPWLPRSATCMLLHWKQMCVC